MAHERLKSFLQYLESFYQPQHPELKQGIGHEIEHIKGVVHRSAEIASAINQNPEKYHTTPVDIGIVTTVACLHDIGNCVGRDNHNIFGYGIIMGKLDPYTVADSIPEMTQSEKNELKSLIDKTEQKQPYSSEQISDNIYKYLCQVYTCVTAFNIAYNGYQNMPSTIETNKIMARKACHGNAELTNNVLAKIMKEKPEKIMYSEFQYDSRLKNITHELHKIYPQNSHELQLIADAVKEHNVDFTDKTHTQRYIASSVYGQIVADADKDNVPETFALRTIAYAINKQAQTKQMPAFIHPKAQKNGIPFKVAVNKEGYFITNPDGSFRQDNENGQYVINEIACMSHVCHQAREREGPSQQQYEQRTGKKGPMPIFTESAEELSLYGYKKLESIKGVFVVKSMEDIQKLDNSVSKLQWIPFSGGYYAITDKCGDDIFSQLDAVSGDTEILNMRSECIEKMQQWADPNRYFESMKEIETIMDVYKQTSTIEAAVDVFENKHYQCMDNHFSNVVQHSLNGEYERSIHETPCRILAPVNHLHDIQTSSQQYHPIADPLLHSSEMTEYHEADSVLSDINESVNNANVNADANNLDIPESSGTPEQNNDER